MGEDRDREAGTAVRARWMATLCRGSDCGTGASLYSGTGGGRMRPRPDEGGTERDAVGGVESELRRPARVRGACGGVFLESEAFPETGGGRSSGLAYAASVEEESRPA
jgi:hypothetical protein